MKNKSLIIVIIAVIVVAGVVAAIALSGNKSTNKSTDTGMSNMSSSSQSDNTSTKPVATDTVKIQNFAFSPANITVKVGTKVTWTNEDTAPHTVTADTSSSDAPSSQQLGNGQSYSFTFTKAGTYPYHCSVHPDMRATVTVTE